MAALMVGSPLATADYFLSAPQKGELISRGQITGDDGALYNIWIVPGYVQPWQHVKDGWHDAGHDLSDYGGADMYRDINRHSRQGWRVGTRYLLQDFAFQGTADTWRDSFRTAHGRVEKRVFGWWFAYPWAVIEATGVSVIRVVVGVPTGVAVGAGSLTLLPVAEFGWPVVRAGYHGVVVGTAVPVVAASWNTVIAPPLALLGQQPAAERADGFWMQRLDPAASDLALQSMQRELVAWRDRELGTPSAKAVASAEREADQGIAKKREAALRELAAEQKAVHDDAQAQRLELLRSASAASGAPAADAISTLARRHGRKPLLDALTGGGLDSATAASLLDALIGPEAAPVSPPPLPEGAKTDPLQRSIELMGK